MQETDVLEPITDQKISNNHTFYLDEEIREPSYYRYLVEIITKSDPEDTITLNINSPGGNAYGMMSIVNAMAVSPSKVTGILMGDGSSAAAIIFLLCDDWVVMPGSQLMIHEVSSGIYTNGHNLLSYASITKENSDSVIDRSCTGFLTEDEIHRVCRGEDIYLRDEQIADRLEKLYEYRSDPPTQLELDLTGGEKNNEVE